MSLRLIILILVVLITSIRDRRNLCSLQLKLKTTEGMSELGSKL